ncbi:hypothetical protein RCC89_16135 [Cytophagaceae bacterium ABcell3]|nr:hypothetical protein RCC89_16135 [Cytophagaceae bacterium ABcell3]
MASGQKGGNMTVVILGATGQIGAYLQNCLVANRAFNVRGTSRKGEAGTVKFDPYKDDWATLGKIDVLINCIGCILESPNNSFEKVHQGLTSLIIKNREKVGNPRLIQVSVLGADEHSYSDFLRTKGLADKELLSHKNSVVVRPSVVCTPGTVMIKKVRFLSEIAAYTFGWLPVPAGFPTHKLQPVMVDDLVWTIMHLCESNYCGVLEISGPEALSYKSLVKLLSQAKGRKIKLLEVPRSVADPIIRNLLAVLVPKLISKGQYDLLFMDNIASPEPAQALTGKRLSDTIPFWENEFSR